MEATALVVLLALLYGERTTDDGGETGERRGDDATPERRTDDPTGTDP